MKRRFFSPLILIAGLMLVNFSVYHVQGQTTQDKPVRQQTVKYTCPMHPEVVRDMPGNCPKCGMKLVEKKDMPKGNMHQASDSTMMKHDPVKMMHDSTKMRKGHMINDSTSMKHEKMGM
jgi:hypothetical protein